MTQLLKRTLSKVIEEVSKSFPCILLTGPRQVGKTTLLQTLNSNNINYVSLDKLDDRDLAKKDPELFLQLHKPPVIIDEVQYVPELFIYIKIYIDNHKDKNGLFWLTGSQKFHLMKGIQESLAGRVAILDLLGLSQSEINNKADRTSPFLLTEEYLDKINVLDKESNIEKSNTEERNIMNIYTKIYNGSFPRLILNNDNNNRDLFYKSYIQTYIERDVKDILDVKDNIIFYNFIKVIAGRTAQLLNYADISKDLGIDSKTVKSWLSVLEMSGIVKLLYPYYNNLTNRIIKTPKIYFLDTGLASYLTGWDSPKTLEAGAMSGAILETYVFSEILKSYWHNGKEAPIYFYRDKDQKEIDFIIEVNNTLYPIEVKKSTMPTLESIKNFTVLEKLQKPTETGAVICLKNTLFPLNREVYCVPVWDL